MTAAIDSATTLNITSLAATNMTSSFTNILTPLVSVVGGAVVATLDVYALAGVRSLATHMHAGGGYMTGLTTPPLV